MVAKGWAQNVLYPSQVSLYSQASAETNGMGGAGVSFVSDNALAVIANPAELGLFSLHGMLGASYMPPIPNQLDAFAVNAGMNVNKIWNELPVKIGVGVGYSNPSYTYPSEGSLLTNSVTTDAANGVTIALGVDYFVKLGLGYTFKWATTEETGRFRGYYKSTYTPDWGALLQIPVADIILNSDGSFTRSILGVTPILNLTFGYSERNFGNYAPGGLPGLPREGDLGWNLQFGLVTSVAGHRWNWLSITWIRQVDAPLVFNGANTSEYDQGLGSFKVFDNLFAGRPTGGVSIGKGWQVQIGQFLYFRAGSATGPEIPTYTTFGASVRVDGLIKGLIFTHAISSEGPTGRFLLDHLDFQFDFSEANGKIVGYRYPTGFKGEPFESLTLVVR
jgi:hypothetical protein